jgi:hypothetical protein
MIVITLGVVSDALCMLNVTGLLAVGVATLADRVRHGRPYVRDPRTGEMVS